MERYQAEMDERERSSGETFTSCYDNQECLKDVGLKQGMKGHRIQKVGEDMDRYLDAGNGMERAMSWKGTICVQGTESKPI